MIALLKNETQNYHLKMLNQNKLFLSRIYIDNVIIVDNFYQNTNNDDKLLFRQNIFDYKISNVKKSLSKAILIALNFTKICYYIDKNKINNSCQTQIFSSRN